MLQTWSGNEEMEIAAYVNSAKVAAHAGPKLLSPKSDEAIRKLAKTGSIMGIDFISNLLRGAGGYEEVCN